MHYEIFKTIAFVILYAFTTYAISKAFWMLGWKGKITTFSKLWGAVSLLVGGIATAVGLVFLIISF